MRYCFRWASLLLLTIIFISPVFSWPSIFPTSTTYYNPEEAYDCYTLFAPMVVKAPFAQEMAGEDQSAIVYLVNMNGQVVHQWKIPFSPLHAVLLKNGNLAVIGQYNDPSLPLRPGWGKWFLGGAAGLLTELNWQGETVFEYTDPRMHHDFAKLPNGHYMYLRWERVPPDLVSKVRGGIKGTEFSDNIMFNDRLVEVDGKGKVVWEWHANEHLDPKIDIIGPLYKRNEWCHGNSIAVLQNGNILLTSRSLDSILVIDKTTGKITFRWGSGNRLNQKGEVENVTTAKSLGGPHDASLIPGGYPGAGHYLCFSNRTTNGDFLWSRAVEIDPATGQQVWETAMGAVGRKSFSDYLGGAQRLPNGNTLICDGANGRIFQVTQDSRTVWEYVNPFVSSLSFKGAMFKAHAYEPNYCPQFKKLPPAGGPPVFPLDNRQFRIDDIYKDRYPWRWYALIAVACALLLSAAGNVYLWQQRTKRKADTSQS